MDTISANSAPFGGMPRVPAAPVRYERFPETEVLGSSRVLMIPSG